jgi:SAM-dependent methyltransferase
MASASMRPWPARSGFVPLRERLFRRALRRALSGARSVLDVGCGVASPVGALGLDAFTIGLDRCRPDLEQARAAGTHRALVLADARSVDALFAPRSVDVVVALDVVEHLERPEAVALLARLERVARHRVVVFTPNGFVPQPGTAENPWQEHRSGFTVTDMRRLGYRVCGTHGLWFLFGAFGACRLWPGPLWRRVADATAPAVGPVPALAFGLLCVKDVTGRRVDARPAM